MEQDYRFCGEHESGEFEVLYVFWIVGQFCEVYFVKLYGEDIVLFGQGSDVGYVVDFAFYEPM